VLYNGSEMALTVYACAKIGAVFTPLNFRLPAGEIEYIVNDAEAKMVLFGPKRGEAVEGARPSLESVAEYVFTDDDREDADGRSTRVGSMTSSSRVRRTARCPRRRRRRLRLHLHVGNHGSAEGSSTSIGTWSSTICCVSRR